MIGGVDNGKAPLSELGLKRSLQLFIEPWIGTPVDDDGDLLCDPHAQITDPGWQLRRASRGRRMCIA